MSRRLCLWRRSSAGSATLSQREFRIRISVCLFSKRSRRPNAPAQTPKDCPRPVHVDHSHVPGSRLVPDIRDIIWRPSCPPRPAQAARYQACRARPRPPPAPSASPAPRPRAAPRRAAAGLPCLSATMTRPASSAKAPPPPHPSPRPSDPRSPTGARRPRRRSGPRTVRRRRARARAARAAARPPAAFWRTPRNGHPTPTKSPHHLRHARPWPLPHPL